MMARFARDCLHAMNDLTKRLEVSLGPGKNSSMENRISTLKAHPISLTQFLSVKYSDTGELSMRCGLHSGPVTAGVLRGELTALW